MNPIGSKYSWMSAIFTLGAIGCKSRSERLHDLTRENLKLTFQPANRFEFLYYSTRGTFNEKNNSYIDNSVQYFCVGRYESISKKRYQLYPEPFNPDSIPVNIIYDSENKKHLVHLIFTNHIQGNKIEDYQLMVSYDTNSIVVRGVSFNAVIQKPLYDKIRIDILVADFFKYGIPRAIYSKLSTGWINTKNTDELRIMSPITRYHFYYHQSYLYDKFYARRIKKVLYSLWEKGRKRNKILKKVHYKKAVGETSLPIRHANES